MANKAISELPQALNVNNQDLFVLEQSGIAKKLTAETFITEQGIIDALVEALDGHGGIQSVTLQSLSGRIRTYLITFSDGSATTFQVLDGTSIDRIVKTSTAGLTDTYTIFMTDGTTTFFTVRNGADGTVSEAMLNDALKDKAPAVTETTESSAIANFTDGADDMVMHNVVVEINPVQSGSGDPSPDNIRPITGWTGVNVTRAGKNLYNREDSEYNVPVYSTNGTASSYPDVGVVYVPVLPNTKYSVTLQPNSFTYYFRWIECDKNKGFVFRSLETYPCTSDGSRVVYFTTRSNTAYLQVAVNQYGSGDLQRNNWEIQIEKGDATTYEPYQGETVTVDWTTEAGTVYGGTLDVTSGLLTANRKIITLDGSQSIVYASKANRFFHQIAEAKTINASNQTTDASVICDKGRPVTWGGLATTIVGTDFCCAPLYGKGVAFRWDSITTAADWKTYFTNNPTQFSYELDTPQTYQLTPQEVIKTLLGMNNVWADTGDTSVTYTADTKLYIEKLTMPTEDDLVANQAITSGKYFMVGNSLYLALANIASGAAITIGTNAQRVSLADALNTINS